MGQAACTVVVVWAALVLAGGLVGAQTNCAESTTVRSEMATVCGTYLQSSTMTTPDVLCCYELNYVQVLWGPACWCELYVTANFTRLHVDPVKAYALPRDCNVNADMSNCTDPSAVPPPGSTTPTSGTPTTAASGNSSGHKSLALPIGAAVGGLAAGAVMIGIIWLVVWRCRASASPKPKPKLQSGRPDNDGDKMPADMDGYGV